MSCRWFGDGHSGLRSCQAGQCGPGYVHKYLGKFSEQAKHGRTHELVYISLSASECCDEVVKRGTGFFLSGALGVGSTRGS